MSSRVITVVKYTLGDDVEPTEAQFSISNDILPRSALKDKFPEAFGLKYSLDGLWIATTPTEEGFLLPQEVERFLVYTNLFVLNGNDEKFLQYKSEITNVLRQAPPRKIAVLIGNSKFPYDYSLAGATKDVDVMSMMFSSTPFNFTVLKCLDFTTNQMKTIINDAVSLCTKDTETFLCSVSTHGYTNLTDGHQMLKGVDNASITLQDMLALTGPDRKTQMLASTPRIYIINACRIAIFDEVDAGVPIYEEKDKEEIGAGYKEVHVDRKGGKASEGGVKECEQEGKESEQGGHKETKQEGKENGQGDHAQRHRLRSGGPCSDLITDNQLLEHFSVYCPPNHLIVYGCPKGQGVPDYIPEPFNEALSWLVCSIREVWRRKNQEQVNLLELLTEANGYCCHNFESQDWNEIDDVPVQRKYTTVLEHRLTSEAGLFFSSKNQKQD